MTMWEDWRLEKKKGKQPGKGPPVPKKEIARVRTQGPWKKAVKAGTSVPTK